MIEDPNNVGGFDMSALEKMAAQAPKLAAGLDGKLHAAPKDREPTDLDKAAWALAKAVADAEGKWLHRKLKRLMPRRDFDKAQAEANGGKTFAMRKLLNEFDVKITQVMGTPDEQGADFEAGIQRRHLQVWRGDRLMGERVWEWSRTE